MHWNPSGTEPPATVLQSPAHQCYWSHYVLNVNNECSDDVNNTHMMNVKTRTQFQEVLCKNPNKALKLYSKFYRLFVTPSAPGAVKSVRCAFFFELLELIKTKITSLICATTVLDKNLDFRN